MADTSSGLPVSTTTLSSINTRSSLNRLLLIVILLLACGSRSWGDSRIVGVLAYKDDAYVAYDGGLKQWTIGSRGRQVQIGFSKTGALSLLKVWNPEANRDWGMSAETEVG